MASSPASASNSTLRSEAPVIAADAKMRVDKSTTHDFGILPMPRRLRHDPGEPFHFGMFLNLMFGFASTFTVTNLYWCQPLLIQFSEFFGVSYSRASTVPTLLQAGYAVGLVLLSPLGDIVRRRPFLLMLVGTSATLTIALAVTKSFAVFEAISFLIGVVTVTPQVLIPLVADLAPPERRASAIAVVFSGLLFGILVARVLAGIIAEFSSFRVVYYVAIGVQYVVLAALYLVVPDYPAKGTMPYWKVLTTMAKYAVTEPILIQTYLVAIPACAVFANYWVTLTFLLGGPPYFYSTLVIGLFGLVGMAGVASSPLSGFVNDRLVPWWGTMIFTIGLFVFQAVQFAAGGINVAAVVIACFGIDAFRQAQQISLNAGIFEIAPEARARLNAVLIFAMFIGQVMGTSVGTKVFVEHGWRASAGLSLAWIGIEIPILLLRGPHVKRYAWFGYDGGFEARKSVIAARKQKEAREAEEAAITEKNSIEVASKKNELSDRRQSIEVGRQEPGMSKEQDASDRV